MKQLTSAQFTSASGLTRMNAGFVLAPRGPEGRRRLLDILRPQAAVLPLDLNEWEIIADLDPGMVDWEEAQVTER